MKFFRNKKIVLITLLFIFGLNLMWAKPAHAFLMEGITTGALTLAAQGIGYIFGWIASILFGIGGFLIDIALTVNQNLLASPTINTGWQIILNITNLGFVLAIIVMAFATIFQFDTYGMKKALWRLVVAALLVNFSLVIAGAFISVADILIVFLKDRATLSGPGSFPEAFAGIFRVQTLLNVDAIANSRSFLGASGEFSAATLNMVASIFFVALFTLFGALALLATAVMLLIRYVALGILLILSPIVWLFWIFPGTRNHWKKWWTTFLDWVFFAPAVLFFLYLAVVTMGGQEAYFESISKSSAARYPTLVGSGLANIGNLVIVLGFVFGGLIVAKKLSNSGGSMFYGWAERGGKGIGRWAGRKGIRAGTAAFRGERGRTFVENLQKGEKGVYKAMGYIGGKRLGRALSGVGAVQGERLVKQADEHLKSLSDKQLALRMDTLSRDERAAALTRLTKNKNLDMVPNLAKYIANPSTKKIFESYGRGKEYGDMEKTAGFNTAMLTGKDEKGGSISREEATKKFRESYSIKDYDKLQGDILGVKAAYGLSQAEHDEIRKMTRQTIFDVHPGAITKMRTKLKGEDFGQFQEELDKYIEEFERTFPEEYEGEKLKGIEIPIKVKLKYIDRERPQFSNWARATYNSRKNFAGSLLGAYYVAEREEGVGEASA